MSRNQFMEIHDTIFFTNRWKRIVRRLFLLTLPISIPLWFFAFLISGLLVLLANFFFMLKDFWD